MTKRYFNEINIARGLGVLFVLLGHSFPRGGVNDFNNNVFYELLFNTCYSFHMALFFFLSGFCAGQKLLYGKVNLLEEVKKKAKRLLVPYLVFSFITVILKQVFSAYAYNSFDVSEVVGILIGKNANGGLWFLWSLFMISVITAAVSKVSNHKLPVLSASAIVLFALFVLLPAELKNGYILSSLLNYICKYMLFYVLGIAVYSQYDRIKVHIGTTYWYSAACAALLLVLNYMYDMRAGALYLISAVIGIAGVMNASILISSAVNKTLYAGLDNLGTYSYDIYLLSYFVQVPIRVIGFTILHLPYTPVVIAMFVFGAVVPLLVSKYIVRKNKILSALLVGI